MKTEAQKDAFRALLAAAGLSISSPRANSAMAEFNDESNLLSQEDLVAIAVKYEAVARQSWIDTALEPWCKRHGITFEQGLSILARDDAYNPKPPHTDLVTFKSLFEWSGQQNDFAEHLLREIKDAAAAKKEDAIEDKWKAFGFNSVISTFSLDLKDFPKYFDQLMDCDSEEEINQVFLDNEFALLHELDQRGVSNEEAVDLMYEHANNAQKIANETSPDQDAWRIKAEWRIKSAIQALSDMAVTYGHDFVNPETLGAAKNRMLNNGGTLAYLSDATEGLKLALNSAQKMMPKASEPTDKWGQDSIQFARLLCEINSTQKLDIGSLLEAMDVTKPELDEIFDRAHVSWDAAKATNDVTKAVSANVKVADLSGSALDRAVAEVYGAPFFTTPPVYTNECVLPSQEQIIQVDSQLHSGWLYHDKHKTYYALFANLGDCLSRTNPLKEWEHNSDFESFEEEVIDAWLMTGVDVEAEAASNAPTGDSYGG
jgi:hypothetical protein